MSWLRPTDGYGILLETFLYCSELREIIHELKCKGDFRPEVLKRVKWVMALFHLFFLTSMILVLLLLWGLWDYMAFIGGLLVGGYALIWNWGRGQANAIISVGEIAESTMRYANYEGGGRGWNLGYEFTGSSGVLHRGRSKPAKWHLEGARPEAGDHVLVFYSALNSKRNYLFIPYLFRRICISKSRYERLCNEPLAMR